MTEEQYLAMEEKAKAAFDKMPDRLAGDYFPLKGRKHTEREIFPSHSCNLKG